MQLASLNSGPHTPYWLTKTFAFALALVAIIALSLSRLQPPQPHAITGDRENAQILTEYYRRPVSNILLVGTSLTYRLKEGFFQQDDVRNIALPGRSVLTGLSIVAAQPILPKILVIEDNILVWPIDADLVRAYSPSLSNGSWLKLRSTPFAALKIQPVAAVAGFLFGERPERILRDQRAKAASLLDSPVGQSIPNPEMLDGWQKMDLSKAFAHAEAMIELAKRIRARGTTVVFYSAPFSAALEQTAGVSKSHAIIGGELATETFPHLQLDVDRDQLRWSDEAHLDERSAVLVARSLERALDKLR